MDQELFSGSTAIRSPRVADLAYTQMGCRIMNLVEAQPKGVNRNVLARWSFLLPRSEQVLLRLRRPKIVICASAPIPWVEVDVNANVDEQQNVLLVLDHSEPRQLVEVLAEPIYKKISSAYIFQNLALRRDPFLSCFLGPSKLCPSGFYIVKDSFRHRTMHHQGSLGTCPSLSLK